MASSVARKGEKVSTADDQWRAEVSTRLQESANAHQQTAVILERLKGQLDLHDSRIKALEGAPATSRDVMSSVVQWVGLALSSAGCLLSPFIAGGISAVVGIFVGVAVWFITTH